MSLEEDTGADLKLPHRESSAIRRDRSCRGIVDVDGRAGPGTKAKIGVVEDVCRFDPALQLNTLPELEVPEDRGIDVLGART